MQFTAPAHKYSWQFAIYSGKSLNYSENRETDTMIETDKGEREFRCQLLDLYIDKHTILLYLSRYLDICLQRERERERETERERENGSEWKFSLEHFSTDET